VTLLETGRRKFIVDLSGLTHIDSTGIGTFIASLGQSQSGRWRVAMAGAGEWCGRLPGHAA